jgi:AcrR family transcriptional regulator
MESALPLRERHKARRREAIVAAARELLHERPAAQLTVERIAERAEVAPATVYNLVGSRAELWAALSDAFMDDLEHRLAAPSVGDPVARARRVVSVTCELFAEDPVVSRALLRGWEESGHVLRRGPLTHLVDAFTAAQASGVLAASVEPRVLASHVGTACVGALHQWAAGQIDDEKFRARSLVALDVALAAAATEPHREAFVRRIGRAAA